MFGAPKSRARPEPDEDPPPPVNYAAEVERQLRIADAERWARLMWNEILADYADEARRQRYITVRRR